MDMRKFDETKASEPRMVWQLGLLYYSLLNVEIWSTLVTATKNIYTTPIQSPFEIYDSLEDWNNDDDAKVFHRELFDGSIRTMSALIEFLDPSGDLANTQLTLDDFKYRNRANTCTRYKHVDFDEIVLDGKMENMENSVNAYYKDSDYLVRRKTFYAGTMNMGISLYEAPKDGTKFIIKKIASNSHEHAVMKKFAPFDESCNVVGARLFEGERISGIIMQPLSGDLTSFFGPSPMCSEKVARKVCLDIAKSYRCMIERHGLYYFDIKLENIMYACDTETNAIKLFAGDFGGFTEKYRSTAVSIHTILPYDHFFIYNTQEKGPAVAYPIDELRVVLARYKYLNQDVENVNENDLFVAVPNEEKPVLLRVGDGMYEKYLELVQQDEQPMVRSEQKVDEAAQQCELNSQTNRCKKAEVGDGNCDFNETTKRCRKKRSSTKKK